MNKCILVTGGSGYIGSHTIVSLLGNGYDVISLDNYSNSNKKVYDRIRKITKKPFEIYDADMRNIDELDTIFTENTDIQAVIHFAGLKAVGKSVDNPLLYYENNVVGTMNLLKIMDKYNIKTLIFSSSATVYSPDNTMPVNETSKVGPINPYGRTKLIIEQICKDIYHSDKSWNFVMLRYFNPVGAHRSGLIGEDPTGIPNNLMPYILQVMTSKLPCLSVYGKDYDTPDGTGVRDFIHVTDLAEGHVAALQLENPGYEIFNLGTGKGYSVLNMIKEMEDVSDMKITYRFTKRREGDVGTVYTNTEKADTILNWSAKLTLRDMCEDAWNWKKRNVNGY